MQLLDLPGIIEGAKDGKGRGRQVIIICLVYTFILENLFRASCFFRSWKFFNLVFVIVVVTDNDEIEFYQSSILWFYFLNFISLVFCCSIFNITFFSPLSPFMRFVCRSRCLVWIFLFHLHLCMLYSLGIILLKIHFFAIQVISTARTCNCILIVLDAIKPITHKRLIEKELEGFGIR